MKHLFWFSLLVTFAFSITGCKKSVEEQMEGKKIVKNITIDGKKGKLITHFYRGTKVKSIESRMVNGKPHGLAKHWHRNGKLKTEQHWKNGLRVGVWKWYKKDGSLMEKVDYDEMIRKENAAKKKGVKEPKVREPEPRKKPEPEPEPEPRKK